MMKLVVEPGAKIFGGLTVRKALAAQLHRKVAPDLILAQNLRNHP